MRQYILLHNREKGKHFFPLFLHPAENFYKRSREDAEHSPERCPEEPADPPPNTRRPHPARGGPGAPQEEIDRSPRCQTQGHVQPDVPVPKTIPQKNRVPQAPSQNSRSRAPGAPARAGRGAAGGAGHKTDPPPSPGPDTGPRRRPGWRQKPSSPEEPAQAGRPVGAPLPRRSGNPPCPPPAGPPLSRLNFSM